jgi:hypothetical protein
MKIRNLLYVVAGVVALVGENAFATGKTFNSALAGKQPIECKSGSEISDIDSHICAALGEKYKDIFVYSKESDDIEINFNYFMESDSDDYKAITLTAVRNQLRLSWQKNVITKQTYEKLANIINEYIISLS